MRYLIRIMTKSLKYRKLIPETRRLVVKIGSRVLVQKTGRPDTRCMQRLAKDLAHLQRDGYEVVIVTSGASGPEWNAWA